MNWVLFSILAWVFLGLELSVKAGLAIDDNAKVAPSFVFVLLAFVAMSAPARTAVWTAIVLGVLSDLTNDIPLKNAGPSAIIIGPNALGFVLGTQLILSMRGVMIRRNPLTLGFLSMTGMIIAQLVIVAIFTIRTSFDPLFWQPFHELWVRLASSFYTGIVGAVMALVLLPLAPALNLPSPSQRRFARRP